MLILHMVNSFKKYFILIILLLACRAIPATPPPLQLPTIAPLILTTPPPLQLPTIAPTAPLIATPIHDTSWQELRPGLEQRRIRLFDNYNQPLEYIYITRITPQLYRFEVLYQPDQPQSLSQWLASSGALLVVNGGYFSLTDDKKYIANGLIVVNGEPSGYSYGDFGGMFAVTAQGAELRWLAQKPYNPEESLKAALQSFPILVKPGGILGFSAEHEDGKKARRTVVGQDKSGRIIFLVTDKNYFTLHQLSRYLTESDLDLDMALNLDGGPSSGMLLAGQPEVVRTIAPLPLIIAVYTQN